MIIIGICVLFIIIIGITLVFLYKKHSVVQELNKKYGSIINVDLKASEAKKDLAILLEKKKRLSFDYDNAYKLFSNLQKEISCLEESMEMTDFGVYKPHFNFDDPEEYKKQLELLREKEKEMIRADMAVQCDTQWTVDGSKSKGQKLTKQNHKLMLRAFNGECDAALAKVRWDNILKMEERVKKAYETINKAGEVNKSHITYNYLELKIKELRLTHELQEKIKQEKEEQRQIREQMRDEERAQREIEKAKEEAEKEEARYLKALEKAREEVQKASGDKLIKLNQKVAQLEAQLKSVQELKARAISRAQITKSGHIYVISNTGSFGENIYKIGMTRRLEPLERIRELGDASVPFSYDVHALIYSDNAPELENKIHKYFEIKRVNLVNPRREFFSISLDEFEQWAQQENIKINLIKIAESQEYRETMAIRLQGEDKIKQTIKQDIPKTINDLFSDVDEVIEG